MATDCSWVWYLIKVMGIGSTDGRCLCWLVSGGRGRGWEWVGTRGGEIEAAVMKNIGVSAAFFHEPLHTAESPSSASAKSAASLGGAGRKGRGGRAARG